MTYKCNMLQVHFDISVIVFLAITGDFIKKLMTHKGDDDDDGISPNLE